MGCPVCNASFRGAATCSRCGAGLGPLMAIAVHAWRLREAARVAFETEDFARAHVLAKQAQALHFTAAGRGLEIVAGWAAAVTPAR